MSIPIATPKQLLQKFVSDQARALGPGSLHSIYLERLVERGEWHPGSFDLNEALALDPELKQRLLMVLDAQLAVARAWDQVNEYCATKTEPRQPGLVPGDLTVILASNRCEIP